MFANIHKFREKMDAGHFCLGAGIGCSDPSVVEALAESVDFFWIDLEHSPINLESLQSQLIAARAGGTAALVRVPSMEIGWIKRVLDTGAEGIIVPQIRSAEEVSAVAAACRYPPQGKRGYGPRRPSRYGRHGDLDYLQHANKQLFVSVQIETVEAYQDLDKILLVPGIDSIVIGPNDLAGSMGLPTQTSHPQVVEAIKQIIAKSRRAGRYVGIGMGPDENYAHQAARLGVQWAQCGGDFSYMIAYVDHLFGRIRSRLTP
jgi:2-dehydro-3-deoxyglucarate aldolase/4-hydroxy-2-oxoheptanedioate aldolase